MKRLKESYADLKYDWLSQCVSHLDSVGNHVLPFHHRPDAFLEEYFKDKTISRQEYETLKADVYQHLKKHAGEDLNESLGNKIEVGHSYGLGV